MKVLSSTSSESSRSGEARVSNLSTNSSTLPVCLIARNFSVKVPSRRGRNRVSRSLVNSFHSPNGRRPSIQVNKASARPSILTAAASSFSFSIILFIAKYRSALKIQPSGSSPVKIGNSNLRSPLGSGLSISFGVSWLFRGDSKPEEVFTSPSTCLSFSFTADEGPALNEEGPAPSCFSNCSILLVKCPKDFSITSRRLSIPGRRQKQNMESAIQYDSLDVNDVGATFEDLPECGDGHPTEGLPSPNNLCTGNEETFQKPYVGMEFDCLEKAYHFYNEYASFIGFSIRRAKNRRSNIDGELLYQKFCCSKEGERRKKSEDDATKIKDGVVVKVRRRNVKSIRVGCNARLDVKRTTNGKWAVLKFDEEHNHELAKQGDRHLLRSQRRRQGDPLDMRSTRGMYYFTGESGESGERKIFKKGDVKVVLDYFAHMKSEDPSFFYAVQVKDDQMINFFWSDARSRRDFGYFGDVIYFRRTYGVTKYGRPFAPIFGVNHHLQTIVFGCALLLSETEDSYVWLFETFLKATCGHRPNAIVTDEDEAVAKAIEQALPGTQHRLCLSHIFEEATKHLDDIINSNDDGFITDMKKCIYEPQWGDDFESRWAALLDKYKISENEWLDDMYNKRQQTFPVYSRHIFHADMMTTQRIESINSFFNGYLNDSLPVKEFIGQYEKALAHRREEEANEDIDSQKTKPVLKLDVPMEQQAAEKYTGTVFKAFHKQFCGSFNYIAEETTRVGTNWAYAVSRWGHNRSCIVNFNICDNDIRVICDCQNFEFTGILCRHIFKVFTVRNIMLIPRGYLMKRWTKKARYGVVLHENQELQVDFQSSLPMRYNDLCHLSFNFCAKASASEEEYESAKHNMETIIRELEKVAEEDMTLTQPNIDQIRSFHFPVEVVDNIGSSSRLLSEEDQTLTSSAQVTLQSPRLGDERTGFWLRL